VEADARKGFIAQRLPRLVPDDFYYVKVRQKRRDNLPPVLLPAAAGCHGNTYKIFKFA
jgi:hypothetical protein